MPFEEKPVNAVPSTYVPRPGYPHPVRTGESWVSIARDHGLDPWDLIDFNFPGMKRAKQVDFQRATRHVNWYLREYVGCLVVAPDGHNWAFSSGVSRGKGVWKGGVIFIPVRLSAPPPAPPPVSRFEPLPEGRRDRFREALDDLERTVNASQDPRIDRYRCWISKLRAGGDDRVIQWPRIYPTKSAHIVVGPLDVTRMGLQVGQEAIQYAIKSVQDVEDAGRRLKLITYLRSDILFTREMTSESKHLENFRMLHDDVVRAIEKLDKWANVDLGGSSGMPTAYVSIKDWIARRQQDPDSVYSCL
jgi:hypothetical protein